VSTVKLGVCLDYCVCLGHTPHVHIFGGGLLYTGLVVYKAHGIQGFLGHLGLGTQRLLGDGFVWSLCLLIEMSEHGLVGENWGSADEHCPRWLRGLA
jgi:hypothetical protein